MVQLKLRNKAEMIFSSCSVLTGSVVFGTLESPPTAQIFLLSWLLREVGSLTLVQLLYWPPPPPFSNNVSMATLLETMKEVSSPTAVLIHAVRAEILTIRSPLPVPPISMGGAAEKYTPPPSAPRMRLLAATRSST